MFASTLTATLSELWPYVGVGWKPTLALANHRLCPEMQATIVGRCNGFIGDEPRRRRALAQIRREHLSFSHQNIAFTFMA